MKEYGKFGRDLGPRVLFFIFEGYDVGSLNKYGRVEKIHRKPLFYTLNCDFRRPIFLDVS